MNQDLRGMFNNIARLTSSKYRSDLDQLYSNICELVQRTRAGDMTAVEEFAELYCLNEGETTDA